MDGWNDGFTEPNEDDRTARRVLSLAIILINAERPLSTTDIRREIYPSLTESAFRKTFSRDRERLVLSGLQLTKTTSTDGQAQWEVDGESTFVRADVLSQEDALTLDFLLLPIASDPTYPYARDLRLALAKIDRSFDGSSLAILPPEARRRNNNLTRIEQSLLDRRLIRIKYRRADDSSLERTLAPFGLFHLRGETYMVAARAGEDKTEGEPPHTYNLSRVISVRQLAHSHYDIPDDFDVRDYIRLPFQMGSVLYEATFLVPQGHVQDLMLQHPHSGTFEEAGGQTRFKTLVCDEDSAAAWAIAEGLRPLSPQSLVDAWRLRLITFVESEF